MSACQTPNLHSITVSFPKKLAPSLEIYQSRGEKLEEAYVLLLRYLLSIGVCATLDRHRIYLHQLNEDKVRAILGGAETFNAGIHQQLGCLVRAITDNSTTIFTLPDRIRRFFLHPRLLTTLEHRSKVLETNDIFLLKSSIKKNDILFEAVMGLVVTNHLRTLVPNFMYTYGIFRCSGIKLSEDGEVREWCTYNGGTPYLVIEKIRYGIAWEDFVQRPDITDADLLAVLYQLFNALYLAQRLWNFVHRDFFNRNWFIREMQEPIAVPYYGTQETVTRWIVTRYIPCIIDYSMSRAVIGGVEIVSPSELDDVDNNYYPQQWALADIDLLLVDTHVLAEEYRDPSFLKIVTRLEDFVHCRIQKIQEQVEEENRVNGDDSDKESNVKPLTLKDFEEFLLFAEANAPPPIVTTIPKNCWSFQSQQQALTDCDFYTRFGTPKALSAFAYCQMLNAALSISVEQYNLVRRDINYYNALGVFQFDFVPHAQTLTTEFGERLAQNPFIPSIQGMNKRSLNEKFQQEYIQRVAVFDEMYLKIEDLEVQLRANECALREQDVSPSLYETTIRKIDNFIKRARTRLQRERKIINDNSQIAREKGIK